MRLSNGNVVMAYDDSATKRTPLVLVESKDDGETWSEPVPVVTLPGEYSYPVLLEDCEKRLHLLYTHDRIRYTELCVRGALTVSTRLADLSGKLNYD